MIFVDLHVFFTERELRSLYAIAALSVCLSSVTLVQPTQPVEIFGNFSSPSIDIHGKFYGDRSTGTPLSGGLNAKGVAKYSDFSPFISETVQYRR